MNQHETDNTVNPDISSQDNIEDGHGPGKSNDTAFFPVSEGKLMTLYILSFGLYGIYWFYKNWKLQQHYMDKKIYPVWRAIFSIFFTHSLFNRINQQASQLDKKHQFNANLLATIFVAAIVLSNILDRLTGHSGMIGGGMTSDTMDNMLGGITVISSLALFLLSTYPLVKVQATANRINNDILGYLNHKYSLWNYILIVLGTVLWLLIAMGLLVESIGFAVPE